MASISESLGGFGESMGESVRTLGEYLPYLGAALVLLLAGWIIARLLRGAFIRFGAVLNRLLQRVGSTTRGHALHLSTAVIALLGNVLFWIVILLFAALAARTARLDAFTDWLDRIVTYLPTLLAGGLIALAGYLVSKLVRDVVSAALAGAGSGHHHSLGIAAQAAVFLTAIVIGLDQVGIDVTFLITLSAVVIGGILLSLAIAFGFGAREFVGNLIAANEAQRVLERGQLARIGEAEGRVIDITPTCIVLMTDRGKLLVPAKHLQREALLIIAEDADE